MKIRRKQIEEGKKTAKFNENDRKNINRFDGVEDEKISTKAENCEKIVLHKAEVAFK